MILSLGCEPATLKSARLIALRLTFSVGWSDLMRRRMVSSHSQRSQWFGSALISSHAAQTRAVVGFLMFPFTDLFRYILPNSLLKFVIQLFRRVNYGISHDSPRSRRVDTNQQRPEPSRPLAMRRDHSSTHQVAPSHTECQSQGD